MGKHDKPTLQMIVQGGRLLPGGPYEAEVLDTYQNGAELTVEMHQKRSLPLLKKYWAILRDVVDNCKTPWNSPDEASDALKLALGVTDIGKTVKGQWFIRAGSISFTSMDQGAFKDFFDKAMAVLAEVTGIDPETLTDRYRHLAETEPSDAPPASDVGRDAPPDPIDSVAATSHSEGELDTGNPAGAPDDSGSARPDLGTAANPSSGEEEKAAGGDLTGALSASPAAELECIEKMMATAVDKTITPKEASEILAESADMWLGKFGDDRKPFVTSVFQTCKKILRGELPADKAKIYLEGLAA